MDKELFCQICHSTNGMFDFPEHQTEYMFTCPTCGKATRHSLLAPEKILNILKSYPDEEILEALRERRIGGTMGNWYKPAFLGAMGALNRQAIKSADWIKHVTGTGGDSEPHYWPTECETCKQIAKFISEVEVLKDEQEKILRVR